MAGAATIAQGITRRRQIVSFIRKYSTKHGFAPSIEEIADGVKLSSKTAVRHHLAKLQEDGVITMQPGKYRSLQIVTPKNGKIGKTKIA